MDVYEKRMTLFRKEKSSNDEVVKKKEKDMNRLSTKFKKVKEDCFKRIFELYKKKYPGDVLLKKLIENNYDGSCLDKAYDKGNEVAIEIYTYTGQKLGQGLSLVANLLSPEAFIFYGGVSKAGERILSPAKDVMKENLINGKDCDIRLIQSALPSGQAGILGASSLIWLE